jgi:hypothetical protein
MGKKIKSVIELLLEEDRLVAEVKRAEDDVCYDSEYITNMKARIRLKREEIRKCLSSDDKYGIH